MQDDRNLAAHKLPDGFASGQAAADHVNGFLCVFFHGRRHKARAASAQPKAGAKAGLDIDPMTALGARMDG